jgi:hypothetical protein
MEIDHIGFLTDDLELAVSNFFHLGFELVKDVNDPVQGLEIAFLKKDSLLLEIIKPEKKSLIKEDILEKYKNKFYHMSLKVKDIDETINSLKQKMVLVVVTNKIPAKAFNNKNIQFILTNIGMIELIEE